MGQVGFPGRGSQELGSLRGYVSANLEKNLVLQAVDDLKHGERAQLFQNRGIARRAAVDIARAIRAEK